MKSVLVIGGTGFIGTEIIFELLKTKKFNVISFSHKENKLCTSYTGDVTDIYSLENVYRNNSIEVTIISCGLKSVSESKNLDLYSRNDIIGLSNILICCSKFSCKKVIFISSSVIYNDNYSAKENSLLNINSFYSFIKYSSEGLISWYKKIKGLEFIIFRCFNCAGKNCLNQTQQDLFFQIKNRKKINIFKSSVKTIDNSLVRDYIHVNDVALAVVKSIDYDKSDIFNIGSGIGYSTKELINKIQMKRNINITYTISEKEEYMQNYIVANIEKSKTILKWTPQKNIDQIIDELF